MTDQPRAKYRFLLPICIILLVAIAVGVMQKTEILDPGWANIISLATCAGGFLLLLAWLGNLLRLLLAWAFPQRRLAAS